MKNIYFLLLTLLFCQFTHAQTEPYIGGVGRGDVHVTQTNILLGEALIYTGGFGRGDIMLAITSQLNKDQIWIGPTMAGNNLFSNGANWALGYPPKMGNIKVDNAAVRDMQLVANVEFDTLFFQNNTSVKAELGAYNLKLKHFTASSDRQLFKTNGIGAVVIPSFNNNKTLKFPVGNGDYNPVTITNYNTSADSIAVRVCDSVLLEAYSGSPLTTANVQRTWFISKNNANTLGVDFIFEWDSLNNIGSFSGYYLNHFNGTNWEIATTTGYGAPTRNGSRIAMPLNGYTGGFSPFTFGDDPSSPLPIVLLDFNAVLNNRKVDLTWHTASEHNNDFFTVERSSDGYNFEPILYVDGAGNSSTLLSYKQQDANPLSGTSYYRLKQTDFDGTFKNSDIRIVNMDNPDYVLVYPNPSRGTVTIQSPDVLTDVKLFTSEGKLIWESQEINSIGLQMASGVYHLNYQLKGGTYTKKIIVLN